MFAHIPLSIITPMWKTVKGFKKYFNNFVTHFSNSPTIKSCSVYNYFRSCCVKNIVWKDEKSSLLLWVTSRRHAMGVYPWQFNQLVLMILTCWHHSIGCVTGSHHSIIISWLTLAFILTEKRYVTKHYSIILLYLLVSISLFQQDYYHHWLTENDETQYSTYTSC